MYFSALYKQCVLFYFVIKISCRPANSLRYRISDAEIIVILILFHSGGFRCFKLAMFADVVKIVIHSLKP